MKLGRIPFNICRKIDYNPKMNTESKYLKFPFLAHKCQLMTLWLLRMSGDRTNWLYQQSICWIFEEDWTKTQTTIRVLKVLLGVERSKMSVISVING